MLDRFFDALLCWFDQHATYVADSDRIRGVWIIGCRRDGCLWGREERI